MNEYIAARIRAEPGVRGLYEERAQAMRACDPRPKRPFESSVGEELARQVAKESR